MHAKLYRPYTFTWSFMLTYDLHKVLAELETKFLTIFLDDHYDGTVNSGTEAYSPLLLIK